MSPQIGHRLRVTAAGPDATSPGVPRRVSLGLAELVVAARLAGDVPLPVRTDGGPVTGDRMIDRLAGTRQSQAHELVSRELARAEDEGPSGGLASLTGQGMVDDTGALDPGVTVALQTLAGGPLSVVLDVAAVRRAGEVRLRSWFGVRAGLVAQLSTGAALDFELAWFDPRLWVSQLTRAVTVEPWVPEPAPLAMPDYVQLPSELLAGCDKAHRERRTDLLAPMAASHLGAVRMGEPREVRPADSEETLALLQTLGGACRGRLRLLTTRRDRPDTPAVTAWLLFDDGWHELRPGRGATSVLRRRDARDLGLFTLPLVEGLAIEGVA
ncbi:MAG: hypothetical protein WKF50_05715 [Nocardioides sp.]